MDKSNQILSEIVIFNKYAKYLKKKKRRETWDEIVTRYTDMMITSNWGMKIGRIFSSSFIHFLHFFTPDLNMKRSSLSDPGSIHGVFHPSRLKAEVKVLTILLTSTFHFRTLSEPPYGGLCPAGYFLTQAGNIQFVRVFRDNFLICNFITFYYDRITYKINF